MLMKLPDHGKKTNNLLLSHKGLIKDNEDPKSLGRVKCYVEGIFEDDDVDKLPWCFPLNATDLGGSPDNSSFAVPEVGTEVIITFPLGDIYTPMYQGFWQSSQSHQEKSFNDNYPETYGKSDSTGNWNKVNKETEEWEFHHSSGLMVHINKEGTVKVHIPKNLLVYIGENREVQIEKVDTLDVRDKRQVAVENDCTLATLSGEIMNSSATDFSVVTDEDINMVSKGRLNESAQEKKENITGNYDTSASIRNTYASRITDNATDIQHLAGGPRGGSIFNPSPVNSKEQQLTQFTKNLLSGGLNNVVQSVGSGLGPQLGETISSSVDTAVSQNVAGTLGETTSGLLGGGLTKNTTNLLGNVTGGLEGITDAAGGIDSMVDNLAGGFDGFASDLLDKGVIGSIPTDMDALIDDIGLDGVVNNLPGGVNTVIDNLPNGLDGYLDSVENGRLSLSNAVTNDSMSLITGLKDADIGFDENTLFSFLGEAKLPQVYAANHTTDEIKTFVVDSRGKVPTVSDTEFSSYGSKIGKLLYSGWGRSNILSLIDGLKTRGVEEGKVFYILDDLDFPKLLDAGKSNQDIFDLYDAIDFDTFDIDALDFKGFSNILATDLEVSEISTFIDDSLTKGMPADQMFGFFNDVDIRSLSVITDGLGDMDGFLTEASSLLGGDLTDIAGLGSEIGDLLGSGLNLSSITDSLGGLIGSGGIFEGIDGLGGILNGSSGAFGAAGGQVREVIQVAEQLNAKATEIKELGKKVKETNIEKMKDKFIEETTSKVKGGFL